METRYNQTWHDVTWGGSFILYNSVLRIDFEKSRFKWSKQIQMIKSKCLSIYLWWCECDDPSAACSSFRYFSSNQLTNRTGGDRQSLTSRTRCWCNRLTCGIAISYVHTRKILLYLRDIAQFSLSIFSCHLPYKRWEEIKSGRNQMGIWKFFSYAHTAMLILQEFSFVRMGQNRIQHRRAHIGFWLFWDLTVNWAFMESGLMLEMFTHKCFS